MNKAEYIDLAKIALSNYNEEFASDLLRSLEDHFEEGMKEGKSEEELCAELGSIEEVLSEIGQQMDIPKKERPVQEKAHGKTKKIYADLGIADVKIVKTTDSEPSICLQNGCDMPAGWKLEEYSERQIYKVKLIQTGKSFQKKGFAARFINSFYTSDAKLTPDIKLELSVPEGLESLEYVGISGDVELHKLLVNILNLNTVDGDIKVHALSVGTLSVEGTSGDLHIHGLSATDTNIRTSSGDINLEKVYTDSASFSTASGDITVKDGRMKIVNIQSMSGDVELHLSEDTDCTVNNMSGDIKVELNNHGRGLSAQLSSMSGSTKVSYGGNHISGSSVRIGEATSKFHLSNMSGNITVN